MAVNFGQQFLISILYLVTGWLGLHLAIPPGYATAVFPATGVAMAFILLFGPRVAPAIFVGSFAMNLLNSWPEQFGMASLIAASGIALGAVLQALAGWLLLRKQAQSNVWQRDARAVVGFLLMCGPLASLVNASWSVGILYSLGKIPLDEVAKNWLFWWIGDAVGAMVFTPLLLAIFEKPIREWTHRKTLLVVPSLVLFSMLTFFYVLISQHLNEKIRNEFHQRVKNNAHLVSSYLQRYEIALAGLQHALENRILTREEFASYVEPLHVRLSGIQSLQWNPRVLHKDRAKIEREAQKLGLMNKGFLERDPKSESLIPATERAEYFPILYAEPASRVAELIGYDIASVPSRRETVERAWKTATAIVSPPFDLIQNHSFYGKKGFVWTFPVFANGSRKHFLGIVIGVFRIQEFVMSSLGESMIDEWNFILTDTTASQSEFLFAHSNDPGPKITTYEQLKANVNPTYISSNVIHFAGRTWMMDIYPSKKFFPGHDLTALFIFVIGLILVVLLESLLILTAGRTDLIELKLVQSERMKALGEMAGGIAHEVNNPLAIISQSAILIKTLLTQNNFDSKQIVSTAQLIETTTHRIAKIIKGLRTIARDAENDPMEVVNIDQLVDETLELCRSRLKAHAIELSVGNISPNLTASGRRAQLSQVLINLLNNAFDAVQGKPGARVEVNAIRHHDTIEISVTDSGLGVADAVADKIMEPFFTTKEVGKGTGLGLSIAQGIMRSHNGTLSLDRTSKNTRFVMRIPTVKENKQKKAA